MLKPLFLLLLFTKLAQPLFAQKPIVNEFTVIDKMALQLPDSLTKSTDAIASYMVANFPSDKEKSRAIFIWVASNIQYDIENMFALNFYEKKEERILKPLRTRRGTCANYAALFTDICTKSGLKSYVVEGYTKQNGFADYIPHAWSAALIDGSWFLFDPTWGSGYVSAGKFFKKINSSYFKADPKVIIKSHMPFDYLWQFLNYPITNQEFYEGKIQQNTSKTFFDFKDSIDLHEKKEHVEQLLATAERIERNGLKNSMIFDRFHHIKAEIENVQQSKTITLYNSAGADYNAGVNAFNDFINFRNKQFVPKKSDPEIQAMLDVVANRFKDAKSKLAQVKPRDEEQSNSISQLKNTIEEVEAQLKEQQTWLKDYFSKSKSGRKSMFYKMTWFGIPIN